MEDQLATTEKDDYNKDYFKKQYNYLREYNKEGRILKRSFSDFIKVEKYDKL